ncbi:hypothetical protein P7C70_g8559, partial [Phenoliferia sp. Uapishka_3]
MGEFETITGATVFHKSGRADNAKTCKAWSKLLVQAKEAVRRAETAVAHKQLAARTALPHAEVKLSKTVMVAEQWKQRHKRETQRHAFGKAIKSERNFHEVYKRIINRATPNQPSDSATEEQHAGHSRHYEIVAALAKTSGRRTASGPNKVSWAQIETMDIDLLTKLFQWCLDHNEVPNTWLIGHIIPIAKKTTKVDDPSTYCGITLKSCLLKLLTTILSERLNEWIVHEKDTTILPDNQGGFRPGYRTEANILTLDHILDQARRAGKDVYVAFVDLKKAFDTVSRGLLWQKLQHLGCSDKVFDLICTLYSGLHTMVHLGSFTGDIFKGEVGVTQGDPLSGTLWDIYLHDFRLQEFTNTVNIGTIPISHLLFADNIALISIGGG